MQLGILQPSTGMPLQHAEFQGITSAIVNSYDPDENFESRKTYNCSRPLNQRMHGPSLFSEKESLY